jgi:hypothetical protein
MFFTKMLDVPYNAIRNSLPYSQVQYFIGYSYVYVDRPQEAVAAFNESLAARPGASHAMQMAAMLASGGFNEEALHFSDRALAELANPKPVIVDVAPVNESDIRIFQETVREDINASQDADNDRAEQ